MPITQITNGEPSSAFPAPEATGPGGIHRNEVDVVGGAQLWAVQFQHITTLALGGGGGLLVLTQTDLVDVTGRWWAALILFALAAFVGMIGQAIVVEEASSGRSPGQSARTLVIVAMMCFGGSA